MAEVISGATNNSGSGGLISGGGSGGGNANGGSGGCRTNEWSVSAAQQQLSSMAANALNTREVTLNSSNYLTFNDFGLSPQYSSFLQTGGVAGIANSNGSNSMLGMTSGSGTAAGGVAVGSGSGADGGAQSQFLLTKFMQPTLSDAEWVEIGRERADR